jgi:hypothetical protein
MLKGTPRAADKTNGGARVGLSENVQQVARALELACGG